MSIKLVSINIEYDKHFDLFFPFLQREQPDVVCVQELFLVDIPKMQKALGMQCVFLPSVLMEIETKYNIAPRGIGGTAIFTRLPITEARLIPYSENSAELKVLEKPNDQIRGLVVVNCTKSSEAYTVATTHFTWTPKGEPNEEQRRDVVVLKEIISNFPEMILAGDMNCPRGGEIFAQIGEGLTDAVPAEVTTTIDGDRHYSGGLELVVDALFLSDAYSAESVRVVGGVSDHKAIVAEIKRR